MAIVLFIIGTGITLYLRQRDKDSKTLDYRVIDDIPIFASSERPEDLKVVYKQIMVNDPRVSRVRFINTGKQVIETDDFLEPCSIRRPTGKLLDFDVVEQSEDNLVAKVEQIVARPDVPEQIDVYPKTLNPGDRFTVQLLYDGGADEKPTITGRVKGQTRGPTTYEVPDERGQTRFGIFLVIIVGVLSATVAALLPHSVTHKPSFFIAIMVVGFIIGMLGAALRPALRRGVSSSSTPSQSG